ncbi:MAG: hypothetical protein EA419_12285, partial [Wenzhouxiangella sp.]
MVDLFALWLKKQRQEVGTAETEPSVHVRSIRRDQGARRLASLVRDQIGRFGAAARARIFARLPSAKGRLPETR